MHAALLSRPQEVTMLTRRIVAGASALALALPAVAAASPIHDPAAAQRVPVAYGGALVAKSGGVTYGDAKYDLQNRRDLGAPKSPQSYADRVGSLSYEQLAAAYGTTKPDVKPIPASTTVASDNDGTDGWQIAALGEAGLLLALGVGGTFLVRARRRTQLGV
jgi:hypothetical protein